MERSSFFNAVLNGEIYDRVYLAEDYARYFASFIGNGVYPTPSTNLQVVQDVSMHVKIKTGKGWINGYFYENTDDLTLNVAIADGVLNRIDRVVLRLDFINREIKVYVKKGSFATSPVAPVLTRNSDMYELGIADVKINKGVTRIVQADITDLRQNNTYCGLVAGVVQQIDTTNLFAQFQSTFDLWFQNVKGQLSTDAAGNLQNQINAIKPSTLEFLGMSGIDKISTPKDVLAFMANNKGFTFNAIENCLKPLSNNQTSLGTDSLTFKDVFVGTWNKNSNGYTKLTNGFILQWGNATLLGGADTGTFTYPIAFPNTVFVVVATNIYSLLDTVVFSTMLSLNKTEFKLYAKDITTGLAPTKECTAGWIAIGV